MHFPNMLELHIHYRILTRRHRTFVQGPGDTKYECSVCRRNVGRLPFSHKAVYFVVGQELSNFLPLYVGFLIDLAYRPSALSQIVFSLGPDSTLRSFTRDKLQRATNDNGPLDDAQSVTSHPSHERPRRTSRAQPSRHHHAGYLHPLGLSAPKTLRAIVFRGDGIL